jgi:hypothetical protein
MAQIERETEKISRQEASVPGIGSRLADVGTSFAERWALWVQLLVLQLAVIGGVFLASAGQHSSGAWQAFSNGHWQFILLALATMSVGFGGATLLYHRLASGQSDQLEEDYRSLVARADSLLKSSLQSEGAPRASRSYTAAPTGAETAASQAASHAALEAARAAALEARRLAEAAAADLTADNLSRTASDIGQRARRVAEATVTSAFDPARNDEQTTPAKTRDN